MNSSANYPFDVDDEIAKKHINRELQTWISHLDAMIDEGDLLAKIISNKLGDKALRDEILDNINENIHLLNEFYTYRNIVNNDRECDDLECHQFYMHQHEQVFEKYIEGVEGYRFIKSKAYKRLLL